ncbi:hypothetical protein K491DRAFT_409049 [Lophiostoma macrostomum CBS 122681]|uniref:Uncharacterized protein n=1 Tax=Lophiostoma macrostomum CBS 122681 TaxID=1314788 RepID=A0A6A6T7N8_9PLEO|nr:hypothetical protein K491DRAFT_409049 [Lophiostoma macrostomum CBS 122681]
MTALGSRAGASLARCTRGTSGSRLGEGTRPAVAHTDRSQSSTAAKQASATLKGSSHTTATLIDIPRVPKYPSSIPDFTIDCHLPLPGIFRCAHDTIAAPTHEGLHRYAWRPPSHPTLWKSPIARLLSHLRGISILSTSLLGRALVFGGRRSYEELSVHALRCPMSFERLRYLVPILFINSIMSVRLHPSTSFLQLRVSARAWVI